MNILYRKIKVRCRVFSFSVLVCLIVVFILCIPTQATLFSLDDPIFGTDSITYDSNSSLQLLDVTLTAGRSINDVSSQLGPGGEFEGFRYASIIEVENFFSAAGVLGRSSTNFEPYLDAVDLFGRTFTVNHYPGVAGYVSPNTRAAIYVILESEVPTYRGYTWDSSINPSSSSDWYGSWLVRSVPDASIMLLLGSSLLGLGVFSRKSKRS